MPELTAVVRGLVPRTDDVERAIRAEAIDHVNEALDLFVRDGRADLTVRIAGIPLDEWEDIDADPYAHPHGLPMKREWLAGTGSHIVLEYVADPDPRAA